MNPTRSLCLFLLLPVLLPAETVERPTPMRLAPAADAPVVEMLTPGLDLERVEEDDLPAGMAPLPDGWTAIRHTGAYPGYVNNSEVAKDFSIEIGAGVLLEASSDAPLLTVVEADDIATVAGVTGEWSRITIRKPLIGYLETSAVVPSAVVPSPVDGPEPVSSALTAEPPAPLPPPPTVNPVRNTDFAPIRLNGRLERTRRIFGRGPEQDYQLISTDGKVIAYLEVDSLIRIEPVDGFLGRVVDVFGVPRKPDESKALILRVESLRLALP